MEIGQNYITRDGFEKLQSRLHLLKTVKRQEVIEHIKIARDFGDLSENAEYDAAKEEQAKVEGEIKELEHHIENAEVKRAIKNGKVGFASKVTVQVEDDFGIDECDYQIVGKYEADLKENKISYESALSQALIDKECGDEINVKLDNGSVVKYKIIAIK